MSPFQLLKLLSFPVFVLRRSLNYLTRGMPSSQMCWLRVTQRNTPKSKKEQRKQKKNEFIISTHICRWPAPGCLRVSVWTGVNAAQTQTQKLLPPMCAGTKQDYMVREGSSAPPPSPFEPSSKPLGGGNAPKIFFVSCHRRWASPLLDRNLLNLTVPLIWHIISSSALMDKFPDISSDNLVVSSGRVLSQTSCRTKYVINTLFSRVYPGMFQFPQRLVLQSASYTHSQELFLIKVHVWKGSYRMCTEVFITCEAQTVRF